jgi:hypothetical protein
MGWVNVCWGVPPDTNVTHVLPWVALLALDKAVKVRRASLFLVHLTLEGASNLLALLDRSDIPQRPWAIQARHPNIDGCLEVIDLHMKLLVVQPTRGYLHDA